MLLREEEREINDETFKSDLPEKKHLELINLGKYSKCSKCSNRTVH